MSPKWRRAKTGGLTIKHLDNIADVWKLKDKYRWAVGSRASGGKNGMGTCDTEEEAIQAAEEVMHLT